MELSIDDLLPFCEKCEGSGEMENPILAESKGGGYGTHIISASNVACDSCGGGGVKLTANGKALIEFFNRAKSKRLIT